MTQRCQAACPMCDRNENGGPDNKHITNAELTLEDCKRIFPPEFIRQLKTMYMCGNLGDPIVARDTLEIFEYFREHNPGMWLSMNTNGGAKDPMWWMQLAEVFDRKGAVIWSIDGLDDTNHLYRQNVVWDRIIENAKAFIGNGGRARWDYIIFQHNEHQVELAEQMSKDLGFERFQKKKTGRFILATGAETKQEHQSTNRKGEETQKLSQPVKLENRNLALAKTREITKTYGSMQEYYDTCNIKCKVVEEKNIFITAEGLLMPCCWTAGRMYKWWHQDPRVEQIWDFIERAGGKDKINVIENSLQDVMEGRVANGNLLNDIESSWGITGIRKGRLGVCAMKCGTEFDPFAEQFK